MPPSNRSGRITPAPHVLFQEVDGETVLLDLKAERYFSLDEVGTRFWELSAEHAEPDAVVARLLGEFSVEETTLRADLGALVEQLHAAGLIVLEP